MEQNLRKTLGKPSVSAGIPTISVKTAGVGETQAEGPKPLKNLRKSIHLEQNLRKSKGKAHETLSTRLAICQILRKSIHLQQNLRKSLGKAKQMKRPELLERSVKSLGKAYIWSKTLGKP